MSTGSSEADVDVEDWEALDATDAVWARSAVSSRVRRLTFSSLSVRPKLYHSVVYIIPLPLAPSRTLHIAPPPSWVLDAVKEGLLARCSS